MNPFLDMAEYWTDYLQRSVLFLDVLRQRGNDHFDHISRTAPNVLSFQFEIIADGRHFDRPVNYCLMRITPPADVILDPSKRPFIVFDPRAGHGPGIGGMKHDSEIGVALKAGHPCYFVGFLPAPVPGQTVEDVCHAQTAFISMVAALHPEADGKPCLIGNCQAGWQIMMTAAMRPDLVGPLMLAGAPLSYWAGVHRKSPMRYLGGLLGGSWLTSLSGDLGNGVFDGAALVANFEHLNPSNTVWKKNYTVFANVDTEAPRFLEFEKWWGSPVLLNAVEMQYIADELFIHNNLSNGEIITGDGTRLDLRAITSPIIVFCSWGDDITPPQQALGWVLDLYKTDRELIASGQTIVYSLHQSIGHLGIFVSAKVATKEHDEFARTMELIDMLPPGLYEAVFTEKTGTTPHPELVDGDYVVQFERRQLDDLRRLGGNDAEDEQRFAAVARLSDINQGLYRTLVSPLVRNMVTAQSAEWLRDTHPHRLRYALFSDRNPLMSPVAALAERIRADRRPAAVDNPLLRAQEALSGHIVQTLDAYRDLRDRATENIFLAVYGSPLVQALVGMRSDLSTARHQIGRDVIREAQVERDIADLEARVDQGGPLVAGLRGLMYIRLGHERFGVDSRSFAMLRLIRRQELEDQPYSKAQFKEMVREQYLLLLLNEDMAMAALPRLLPTDAGERARLLDIIRRVADAAGDLPEAAAQRLAHVVSLFQPAADGTSRPGPAPRRTTAAAIAP